MPGRFSMAHESRTSGYRRRPESAPDPSGQDAMTRAPTEVLFEVAARFSDALEPRAVTRVVMNEVMLAARAARCVAYELEPDGQHLRLLAQTGLSEERQQHLRRLHITDDYPLVRAVRTGEACWYRTYEEFVAAYPGLRAIAQASDDMHAVIALPLKVRGRVTGGLAFSFAQERDFHPEEKSFFGAVADLCAQALERAYLFESERHARADAEQAAEQTRALELIARRLSAAIHSSDVAAAVLEDGTGALKANTGGLWLIDEAADVLVRIGEVGFEGLLESSTRVFSVRGDAPVAMAFRTDAPVWLEDTADYEQKFPASLARIRAANKEVSAAACLPLRIGDRMLGALAFGFEGTRSFREADKTFMLILARHCAQALERARLFDEQQKARVRAEFLQSMTVSLAGTTKLSGVADIVLRGGTESFGADQAVVVVGDDATHLRVVVSRGLGQIDGRTLEPLSSAPISIAARTAHVVTYHGAQGGPLVDALAGGAPSVQAAIWAGFQAQAGVVGAIGFGFAATRRFSAAEQQFLAELSNVTSLAMARARLLESEEAARVRAEEALAQARAADRRKDEFLAMLGHELRNPLAPIATAVQLMKLRGEGDSRARDIIERQVQHMSRLLDDLMDVSRITRGRITLKQQRVDLMAVVRQAVEQTSALTEQKKQCVEIVGSSQLFVLGDPVRLAQVFSNLISNASKYSTPDSTIYIDAARHDDRAVLRVRDQGMGIAAELLPHVFDLFVQAPQAIARSGGGLGLGLAIVKTLVQMHGGSVDVESPGENLGSSFTIRLPVLVEPMPLRASDAVPERAHKVQTSKHRVLVVDDNEDAAELVVEALSMRGFETRSAFDGPSALKEAESFRPDIVVLDIGLPVMDGYELAERFVASQPRPRTLIALTGYGQSQDRARALAAGFDEHFVKPVELDRLLAFMQEHADA